MKHYCVSYMVFCSEKGISRYYEEYYLFGLSAKVRSWLLKEREGVYCVRVTYE